MNRNRSAPARCPLSTRPAKTRLPVTKGITQRARKMGSIEKFWRLYNPSCRVVASAGSGASDVQHAWRARYALYVRWLKQMQCMSGSQRPDGTRTHTTGSFPKQNARHGAGRGIRQRAAPYQTTLAAVSRRDTYQDLVLETGLPSWISTMSPSLYGVSVWA